jgi:hypothetical protein
MEITMSKAFPLYAFVIVLSLAAAASAAESTESWAPWPFHHEEPAGKPDRVTALWNDAVATTAGQTPVRGFGGRLMFYEGKSDIPVKVDGTLIVYAFDETNRDPNNCKPDCKYVFPAEALPKHYSKSKVGHSYSVWLPWDKAGGMQKDITLIVRFEPKIGAPVIGDQLKEVLPGLLPPAKFDASKLPALGGAGGIMAGGLGNRQPNVGNGTNPSGYYGAQAQPADGVRSVSYEQPLQHYAGPQNAATQNFRPAGQENADRRMKTSTIDVPDGLSIQQGLRAPGVAPAPPTLIHEKRYTNNPAAQAQGYPPPGNANAWPASNPSWQNGQAPAPATQQGQPQQNQQGQPRQPLPPQAGSVRQRPWAPGEQFALPNRDRAPSPQYPAAQQYAPAPQFAGPNANGAPAATTGGLQ